MDREYDYVTFLIKHKELFTFDKEQKIFYDKNYELAIGKKAELIEALRKFGKDIFEKEDEADVIIGAAGKAAHLPGVIVNILLRILIMVWGCSFFLLKNS